ncbi:ComEC/Rec2 family competence protein [Candidatus Gracilibacteria bacterium 28_42_T64]|nr:ComEC/Rec2 family competence protein [Candidatus Gracilibacteria bacterium 28_42_T64]
MLSKNTFFILFSISFLIGIFLNNVLKEENLSLLVLLFFVVLFLNLYIYIQKYFLNIICISLGALIGIFMSMNTLSHISGNQEHLSVYLNNNKHNVTFEIENLHKVGEFNREYIANVSQIEDLKVLSNIKAIIIIPFNLKPEKGYIIESQVKLYALHNSPEFQYKNYMLSKDIYFKSYLNSFEIIKIQKSHKILEGIYYIRNKFLETIHQIYPSEEAIFLGGILIGARENLPDSLKTDFNNSGLTHFIAVSGFNITILIIFLAFILQYFPIFIRIFFITIFISFFTILVGENAPVIRASIMGLVGYYILMSGRKGNSLSIILLTAIVMIPFSPLSLNYDVSLHLSFLAVIGIVYTQNFFKKIFYFLPDTLSIREAFVLTMGALSFTLPIMIFNFGQVSLLAPFANIAVTWTIPIAMILGFLSIIVYFIFPLVGSIIAYFTWIFLKFDIMMVHFFGNIEWALLKIDFGIYKNYLEILYFVILIFLVMYFQGGQKKEQST